MVQENDEAGRLYWTDPWRKEHKIHALVNREGIPVCLSISAGNCADCDQAIPLLQKFGEIKGSNILGDRAYGAKKIRLYLTEQGAQYTIPSTKNLLHPGNMTGKLTSAGM